MKSRVIRLAGVGRCRGYRIAQGRCPVAGIGPENDPILQRCGAELIEGVVDLQIEIGLICVYDEHPSLVNRRVMRRMMRLSRAVRSPFDAAGNGGDLASTRVAELEVHAERVVTLVKQSL